MTDGTVVAMRAVVVLLVLASPAAADGVSVRVAGSVGALEEITWAAPEVDVVGSFHVGGRGFVTIAGGYASVDNHTFLADGRVMRAAITGGATINPKLSAGATLGLDLFAFHADPDVLAEHPGVDVIVPRTGFIPIAGAEATYAITGGTAVGVFTRIGLRELEIFDSPTGDRGRARPILAGAFIELRVR